MERKAPVQRLRGRAGVARRARWLSHNPLCVHCREKGRVTEAKQVDHIVALAHGGADDESNLQSLCEACHKEKTAAEMGYVRRREIGVDGWPIED